MKKDFSAHLNNEINHKREKKTTYLALQTSYRVSQNIISKTKRQDLGHIYS